MFKQRLYTSMLLIAGSLTQVTLLPTLDFNQFLFLLTMAYWNEMFPLNLLSLVYRFLTCLSTSKLRDRPHFGVAKSRMTSHKKSHDCHVKGSYSRRRSCQQTAMSWSKSADRHKSLPRVLSLSVSGTSTFYPWGF